MWLEIKKDSKVIVGIHSHFSSNENDWYEFSESMGAYPDIGDMLVDGKIVKEIIPFDSDAYKKRIAMLKIYEKYPIWKQLNILREGNLEDIKVMSDYIDTIRAESNQ